jgi:hypothetical protein
MNKLIGCILIFLGSVTLIHAQHAENFKWLLGKWKIISPNGMIQEHWTIINDSTLRGVSKFIKNFKDTIPQETVDIAYRNGDWYYIPTVQGQNNNQAVRFKIIYQKDMEFISENPAHDFPQRIVYRKIDRLLYASIEGRKNGKYRKQNYDFMPE